MITEKKQHLRGKKRSNTLTVVNVEYVQVPDAEERLNRVFKILMSSLENIENHS